MSSMFLWCNIQYVYMFVHMGPLPVFPLLKTHLFGYKITHQPTKFDSSWIYIYIHIYIYLSGWWFQPLWKYESQLGWWNSQYMEKIKHVETTNQICAFWLKVRYPQIRWFLRQTQRSDSWLYIPAKSHCGCLMPIFVYSLFLLYHYIPSSSIILTIYHIHLWSYVPLYPHISPWYQLFGLLWSIDDVFAVSSKPIPSIIGRALKAALIAVVALTQYSVE